MVRRAEVDSQRVEHEDLDSAFRYIVTKRFTGISQDATSSVLLSNPSNSGLITHIENATVSTGGLSDIDLTTNVTVDSAGTSITPQQSFIGSSTTSSINAEHSGTYTGGTLYSEIIIPGSSAGAASTGGTSTIATDTNIDENNNLLIEVTNRSTGSIRISIAIIYREHGHRRPS